MVSISPGLESAIQPDVEAAGHLKDGTPVFCSVVQAEGSEVGALGIFEGYGAQPESYHALQQALGRFGISTVNVAPVCKVSAHQNRLQSEAADVAFGYAKEEYGIDITDAYAHSWGAQKLAAYLKHREGRGISRAIFHTPSGLQSAFRNFISHPYQSASGIGHEMTKLFSTTRSNGFSYDLDPVRWVALAQQGVVASEHHRVVPHLEAVRKRNKNIRFIGLFAANDMFFSIQSHPVFHHNEILEGSVHTEPQVNPDRVAEKLHELLAA
jgi:hypothetical protein